MAPLGQPLLAERQGRHAARQRRGQAYKARVAAAHRGQRALKGPVVLSATLYPPTCQTSDLGNRLKVLEDALELLTYLNDSQVRRYRDVAFADGVHGNVARVELVLDGQEWAPPAEVEAERVRRAEQSRPGSGGRRWRATGPRKSWGASG
ncbi:RusA family crossover junction endodeoxyribonuclease [Myxococcus virescens]|uniref:RusA family crossover junction endodeoxyribonuclease n=1 Tax=Myxococcus virescens TaxID=83456 RepID=UPI003DA43352